jgi:hypothetical protein
VSLPFLSFFTPRCSAFLCSFPFCLCPLPFFSSSTFFFFISPVSFVAHHTFLASFLRFPFFLRISFTLFLPQLFSLPPFTFLRNAWNAWGVICSPLHLLGCPCVMGCRVSLLNPPLLRRERGRVLHFHPSILLPHPTPPTNRH